MFASNVLAVEVISEKSKDHGFGFRDVRQQVKMPKGHWEGIGHFGFLYFKDHKISQTSDFLISSDGKFVVFTDGPTGNVQAFFSVDRKIVLLEGYVKENGVPESFEEVRLCQWSCSANWPASRWGSLSGLIAQMGRSS